MPASTTEAPQITGCLSRRPLKRGSETRQMAPSVASAWMSLPGPPPDRMYCAISNRLCGLLSTVSDCRLQPLKTIFIDRWRGLLVTVI